MKTNVYNGGAQVIRCDGCGLGGHVDESDTWDWLKAPEGDLCARCVATARAQLEREAVAS